MNQTRIYRFFSKSIQNKGMLFYFLLTSIFMIIVLILTVLFVQKETKSNATSIVEVQGRLFARTAAVAMATSDQELLNYACSYLERDTNILYAALYNEHDSLLRQFHEPVIPLEEIPDTGVIRHQEKLVLAASFPIHYKHIHYGRFVMIYSLQEALQTSWDFTWQVSVISFAVFLLGLLVIYFLIRRLTGNLKDLSYAALKASNGELSQNLAIHTQDETGTLAEAFNNMLANIRSANDHLENEKSSVEKKVESAIRELEKKNKFIEYVFDSVPIVILVLHGDDTIQYMNSFARSYLTNTTPDATHHLNVYEGFPVFRFSQEMLDASRAEGVALQKELLVEEEEGKSAYYSVSVFPLHTETDKGAVMMIENITDRKRVHDIMIQSDKMLSVAGLAAGMAHEINNPLATIVQGSQNILRRFREDIPKNLEAAERAGIDIDKMRYYFELRDIYSILDSIRNAAWKASDIIRNMLSFSRKRESQKVMYSLQTVIDDTISLAYNDYNLKSKYDIKGIRIERHFETMPDVRLTVSEMQQVLLNIIQNAAQAMHGYLSEGKKPVIRISTMRQNGYARIEIEDNGPGIPESIRQRVFEPFFTTKEAGEGTGLGLSVSYMIIKTNHNGELLVESQVGVGTKFIILLPL